MASLSKLSVAIDRACSVGETIAIGMLIGTTAFIAIQVVGRDLLNVGLPWADELARWCGLGLVFLTAPLLLARGMHVRVDLAVNAIPPSYRRYLLIANEVMAFLFCVFFLLAAYFFMQRAASFSTPALGIPNILFYSPAIIGVLLLLVVAACRTLVAVWASPE